MRMIARDDRLRVWPNLLTRAQATLEGMNPGQYAGGYQYNRGSSAAYTGWLAEGVSSLLCTPDGTATDNWVSCGGDTGAVRLGLTPGKTYTAVQTVKVISTFTSTAGSRFGLPVAFSKIGSNPYVENNWGNPIVANVPGTVATNKVTFTVPIGATEAFIRFYIGGIGGTMAIDRLGLFEGTPPGGAYWWCMPVA